MWFLLVMEQKGYEHLECVLASVWNRKDMKIGNVFLLVMEQKGYEHLECVLARLWKIKDMNIQNVFLASYGIERI